MAKPKGEHLRPQYAAATSFVEQCLKRQDSLFTPGEPIWASATVEDLYRRFVGQPDTTNASFDEKFERQLAGAPPATIQLAAELLFVHLLAGNSTGGEKKRELISTVLGWLPPDQTVAVPPQLDEALDEGLAAEGIAYRIARPFLLQYLLEFVRKWWGLGESERSAALQDPWAFKKIASSISVPKAQSQTEILLHLVHPAAFESIMSRKQKRQIAEAFASLTTGVDVLGEAGNDDDDVDRQLLTIRKRLTEREGRDISFYEEKIRAAWQPEADPWNAFIKFAGIFYRLPKFDEWERAYKLELAHRAKAVVEALIASPKPPREATDALRKIMRSKDPVQNIVRWQDHEPFLKWYVDALPRSHAALTVIADPGRPLIERIAGFLKDVPKEAVKSNASRTTLASFFLFAWEPDRYMPFRARPFEWAYEMVGYDWPPDDATEGQRFEHALKFCDRFLHEADQRGLKLRDRLDAQSLVWALAGHEEGDAPEGMSDGDWQAFLKYRGGQPQLDDEDDEEEEKEKDDDDANKRDRRVDQKSLLRDHPVGRLVLTRKNVVLYGPPGTGKTHASLDLADKWRRVHGDDSVLQVTFHPTFAYEDFIEGFRPDASGRFELREGLFVQASELARRTREKDFLLVIDELNRGDVARLFGELITLIEPDKRHEGVRRRLPYSQREFWVPPNLYLLGTMNTADRSVSLLDIAIRRRFCFKPYEPDRLVIDNAVDHHRSVSGVALGELMDVLNQRLQNIGVDRDRAIGHSHFLIAASESKPLSVLRDRLRYDVIPLVEEYCYADRSLMPKVFDRLIAEEGAVDEDLFSDDRAFIGAVRELLNGRSEAAAGRPGGNDDGGEIA